MMYTLYMQSTIVTMDTLGICEGINCTLHVTRNQFIYTSSMLSTIVTLYILGVYEVKIGTRLYEGVTTSYIQQQIAGGIFVCTKCRMKETWYTRSGK